jgi:hypothetical protein
MDDSSSAVGGARFPGVDKERRKQRLLGVTLKPDFALSSPRRAKGYAHTGFQLNGARRVRIGISVARRMKAPTPTSASSGLLNGP